MTASVIGDMPAFPRAEGPFYSLDQEGMTYRQWLVGMALQGYCSGPDACDNSFADMAHWAVLSADAALQRLAEDSQ